MGELTDRIRRVTTDLQLIQDQLSRAAQPGAPHAVREVVLSELSEGQTLPELKAAVDHMRHLLWSYLEASPKSGDQVPMTLQAVRIQRVTEMLKVLQPTIEEVNAMRTPETKSFFDLINQIAATTVDTHAKGAKK